MKVRERYKVRDKAERQSDKKKIKSKRMWEKQCESLIELITMGQTYPL